MSHKIYLMKLFTNFKTNILMKEKDWIY